MNAKLLLVLSLGSWVLSLTTGCLTVTRPDGTRISATGNATVTIGTDGTLNIANSGTAETYNAIANAAGVAAGVAAKTVVKP